MARWAFPQEYKVSLTLKVKVIQLCPTLCDPKAYTVHGILQARMLEWVAFPFSRGSSQPRSPTLQADSLPAEPGKPILKVAQSCPTLCDPMDCSPPGSSIFGIV